MNQITFNFRRIGVVLVPLDFFCNFVNHNIDKIFPSIELNAEHLFHNFVCTENYKKKVNSNVEMYGFYVQNYFVGYLLFELFGIFAITNVLSWSNVNFKSQISGFLRSITRCFERSRILDRIILWDQWFVNHLSFAPRWRSNKTDFQQSVDVSF